MVGSSFCFKFEKNKKKNANILSCLDNCLNIMKILNRVLILKNVVQI